MASGEYELLWKIAGMLVKKKDPDYIAAKIKKTPRQTKKLIRQTLVEGVYQALTSPKVVIKGEHVYVKHRTIELSSLLPLQPDQVLQVYQRFMILGTVSAVAMDLNLPPRAVRKCIAAADLDERVSKDPGSSSLIHSMEIPAYIHESRKVRIYQEPRTLGNRRSPEEPYGDKEELLNYKTEDGERIKIVAGTFTRRVISERGQDEHLSVFETRVYANKSRYAIYDASQLPATLSPFLRSVLDTLEDSLAGVDEVILTLERVIQSLREADLMEQDDQTMPERRLAYLDSVPANIAYGALSGDFTTDIEHPILFPETPRKEEYTWYTEQEHKRSETTQKLDELSDV